MSAKPKGQKAKAGTYDLEYTPDCNHPSGVARFTIKVRGMHISFYGTEIDAVKKFLGEVRDE